jgi:hypothetical protein
MGLKRNAKELDAADSKEKRDDGLHDGSLWRRR